MWMQAVQCICRNLYRASVTLLHFFFFAGWREIKKKREVGRVRLRRREGGRWVNFADVAKVNARGLSIQYLGAIILIFVNVRTEKGLNSVLSRAARTKALVVIFQSSIRV